MKVIPEQYQCDLCHRKYENREDALECEARVPVTYPIGTIYCDAYDDDNHHRHNLTFAVASNRPQRHMNLGGSWACRDNGCGDSLGHEKCSGNSLSLGKYDAVKSMTHPTFLRMVAWLRSQDI